METRVLPKLFYGIIELSVILKNVSNVLNIPILDLFEHLSKPNQGSVVHVSIPLWQGQSIVRIVLSRQFVPINHNDLLEITIEAAQLLDMSSILVSGGISEQSVQDDLLVGI